ncbi:MAG: hypothetical protein JNK68_11190 [Betaproteobacteria bacterium]|nr:hypothetical protein [Betaproteobacteria bacterium]
MGNRLTLYPNVLRLLAHRHDVSLECAPKLWDEAAGQSAAPVGLTPEDTPEWDRVMSSFLKALRQEARSRRSERPVPPDLTFQNSES